MRLARLFATNPNAGMSATAIANLIVSFVEQLVLWPNDLHNTCEQNRKTPPVHFFTLNSASHEAVVKATALTESSDVLMKCPSAVTFPATQRAPDSTIASLTYSTHAFAASRLP